MWVKAGSDLADANVIFYMGSIYKQHWFHWHSKTLGSAWRNDFDLEGWIWCGQRIDLVGDLENVFEMIPILGEFLIHHNYCFMQLLIHKLTNEWIWNSPNINSFKQPNGFEIHGFKSLNSSIHLVNWKSASEFHELLGTQSLMKFALISPKLINSSSMLV